MKRRDFFKETLPATVMLPALINGFSVKAHTAHSALVRGLLGVDSETDKVLVIIQLNGGNDGLNMVIPIEYYSSYYNARQNIAIPQNKILALNGKPTTGLHPGMKGMQTLYNEGKLNIVQAVGYPTPNFSHFRATDIWMTAADSNDILTSGWTGRYLNVEYPNFPNGYPNSQMPHPLAIQIGSVTSLTLQGPAVNMGMSISDPTSFYNFISGIDDPVPATSWGKELKYIRSVTQQTQQYAAVIKDAAANVPNQGVYPANNDLAAQLKIIARLIKGGLKTRVYMASTGGFDTHSNQVNTLDTTTGTHANLMIRISDAIKAFMDDAKALGIEDRVMGLTFSEFGRRIKSNSSSGTDHGAAAPLFVFGSLVTSGITGKNPLLPTNATVNDNIPYQYDFRSVYASLLKQWFCVNDIDLQIVMLKNFQEIPLCSNSACPAMKPDDILRRSGDELIVNHPNPFTQSTSITFRTNGGHTLVQVIDQLGRVIRVVVDSNYTPGTYTLPFDGFGLTAGVYYARLQNGSLQQVRPMLKTR
jgi:uncharacterized protein (DUF1501 family)